MSSLARAPTYSTQSKLWPSELVTIGLLFALKGGYFRAIYRRLKRDYEDLFRALPHRTRLLCALAAHHDWTEHCLAYPTTSNCAAVRWLLNT